MQNNSDLNLLSLVERTLSENPDANQRQLAMSTNLSLGMTNALLKRFRDKGWLYMKKMSARNIQYVLTADGMNELMHRSARYFKRTARLMKSYKEIICNVVDASNCTSVLIVGKTDIEFLFDFACSASAIPLYTTEKLPKNLKKNCLIIFSDTQDFYAVQEKNNNMLCIANLLRKHTVEPEESL